MTVQVRTDARYKFDAHRCHYCGSRWHLTTGWLESVGAVWKCDDCRGAYLAEKRKNGQGETENV